MKAMTQKQDREVIDFKKRISFKKVSTRDLGLIHFWLDEPHVKEFWDNSQAHKDDIENFAHGRVSLSPYFGGIFTYWIGMFDGVAFAFILTAPVLHESDLPPIWKEQISKVGNTYSIDFTIGQKDFIGKGLAAITLEAFTSFFKNAVDHDADTFMIDPSSDNARATHVYQKAGFEMIGDFLMDTDAFKNQKSFLLIKKI